MEQHERPRLYRRALFRRHRLTRQPTPADQRQRRAVSRLVLHSHLYRHPARLHQRRRLHPRQPAAHHPTRRQHCLEAALLAGPNLRPARHHRHRLHLTLPGIQLTLPGIQPDGVSKSAVERLLRSGERTVLLQAGMNTTDGASESVDDAEPLSPEDADAITVGSPSWNVRRRGLLARWRALPSGGAPVARLWTVCGRRSGDYPDARSRWLLTTSAGQGWRWRTRHNRAGERPAADAHHGDAGDRDEVDRQVPGRGSAVPPSRPNE